MSRSAFFCLAAAVAIAVGVPAIAAEPDGRVVFRYEWIDDKDAPAETARLRLSVTSVVPLEDAQLRATLPNGVALAVRLNGLAAAAPWPAAGVEIGALAAGETIVLDVDVQTPVRGGGLVRFAMSAVSRGVAVNEGVGLFVGQPRVKPVERDGVLEYPADTEAGTP